ncbi:MAG TPA: type 1 glutamine amidotransferase domain-containing protein [Chitinophagales bacterium]|nr:type 1 glutamine amidotransferase domain-containing protein [Chitinophagales bacterium]
MNKKLNAKKVAVLVANGFEESEFTKPVEALRDAGAKVDVISLKSGKVKAWKDNDWGGEYDVDRTIERVNASEYDALVLPGGVMNPDQLRTNKDAVKFATDFMASGKPVAAICHGPWTLIETGKIKGKRMTSYHSIKTDLINAGVDWVDEEVVVDKGLVTSRQPDDLPAFCEKMIEEIAEGKHQTR